MIGPKTAVDNPAAIENLLNMCLENLACCRESRQQQQTLGDSTDMLDTAMSYINAMALLGMIEIRDGAFWSSRFSSTSSDIKFSVSSNGSALAISALTVERSVDTLESVLESVGNVVNVVEMLTLGACAATGVACAALAIISPLSMGLDAANMTVDVVQGDWGEAAFGAVTIGVGVGVGQVAKNVQDLGMSEVGFNAFVGNAADGIAMIEEGMLFPGGSGQGGPLEFQMFQLVFAP
jgi:hypothetical protein